MGIRDIDLSSESNIEADVFGKGIHFVGLFSFVSATVLVFQVGKLGTHLFCMPP